MVWPRGYAIDQAVAVLQAAGVNGVVDLGGDVRASGLRSDGEPWRVQIRDPFRPEVLMEVAVSEHAVCTSGNYARFLEIDGHRFSHIIDPRSCWPADAVPSATVIAPTAMQADIGATALSVLGEEGLTLLPEGCEALLVLGSADEARQVQTPGFARFQVTAPDGR
ncbi:MAG: FAD:protein FMN transferase [Planctomycetota bacterium]